MPQACAVVLAVIYRSACPLSRCRQRRSGGRRHARVAAGVAYDIGLIPSRETVTATAVEKHSMRHGSDQLRRQEAGSSCSAAADLNGDSSTSRASSFAAAACLVGSMAAGVNALPVVRRSTAQSQQALASHAPTDRSRTHMLHA